MTLEEVAELEKLYDDMINSFDAVNKKYKDIKFEYSNTENVSYQEKSNYVYDHVYEIYANCAKRILNE